MGVERLEQNNARIDDQAGFQQFDYEASAFDVRCRVVYDDSGLVVQYPSIAMRAA
jgi:hypothetical protein